MTEEPVLRVLRGDPTDEELAALITVLLGRRTGGDPTRPTPPARSEWAAPWRSLRAPLEPGPTSWRTSGRG